MMMGINNFINRDPMDIAFLEIIDCRLNNGTSNEPDNFEFFLSNGESIKVPLDRISSLFK